MVERTKEIDAVAEDKQMPLISVLMPAYNAEAHIAEAIQSILKQSFADFELIILNDGSTDKTSQIIDGFLDPRIHKMDLQPNQGLVSARNRLVAAARGRYIAFLDADDIAFPDRLQKQFTFLESGAADLCGGKHLSLYQSTSRLKVSKDRYHDADIRALLTVYSPLCNPAVMGRAELFKKHPYEAGHDSAEDYSLWQTLALAGYRFANLRDTLITYRIHPNQTTQVKNTETHSIFNQSRLRYLSGLGIQSELCPRPMGFFDRLKFALPFMWQLNQKIPGVSVNANSQIYSRFQERGSRVWVPLTRLERLVVACIASLKGRV
jgi:glycosyltransferase involved in cell wall biosynthesis